MRAGEGRGEALVLLLLALETRAARLQGAFAADPELGHAWRAQTALAEVTRSVTLEDIHVFEGDVVRHHTENRATTAEVARGTQAASDLLRVVSAPGDLYADPEAVLGRCWRAAVTIQRESDIDDSPDLAGIAAAIGGGGAAVTPFLGALRAACLFRLGTMGRAPSAERLVFLAADHALRGAGEGRARYDAGLDGMLRRIEATWILTPSLALTQGRFRPWSPVSAAGMQDLAEGLLAELDRSVGMLPVLRRWRDGMRAAAGARHGKSRLRDLVELALSEPILTSGHVRDRLGVSPRAALYLMQEAEEIGLLALITPRRTYRVWAVPTLAERLRQRAGGIGAPRTAEAPPEVGATSLADLAPGAPVSEAMAELDAALAQADRVLERYRRE
ncbi:helix-turn-helix domain-containing protein [Pseudooceanicola nanhaiensis]|uniref:helix-turn-helix domain-containing protein n=1 Tax=Pseudooceanicola nanhaiensis TaxID=375761 RepID=UPI001CD469D4|nr:helix-turn-helix domain-containing protein [Pseudooceanicola nanhaiensis]MCA0922506.1 hypothetical protein [Pseudooceanicola nanhaiensis]